MLIFVIKNEERIPSLYTQAEPSSGSGGGGTDSPLSVSAGFYNEDIEISADFPGAAEIYYTKDGSLPEKGGASSYLYENPIQLSAKAEEEAAVYKFRAYSEDGAGSEVYTNSYFLGKDIENRYNTLILCISGDDDLLYGYDNGIFVEGRLRDEWIKENPDSEAAFDTPANYNVRGRESERQIYVEMFEPDGNRILAQNAGIRISGNFTRQSVQKSFQIYARSEYDIQDKFKFPLFCNMQDQSGAVIDEFERLKVRNTGNDRSEGFIRDELALTLAADAGFLDVQTVRPISVYINNKYQGLYWLHSTYDDEYFKEKYGKYDGEMVVIGKSETNMVDDGKYEFDYAAEYNEKYQHFSTMDLTSQENIRELNRFIDIENYIQYYAIQVYASNRDWPYNNMQAYRYVSPDGTYKDQSVFDGRYRYLLYDMDTTMGLGSVRDSLNVSQSFETFQYLEDRNYAPLFTALMKREDCRLFFASYICDLANSAFSPENVTARLDELHQMRIQEMRAYIKESESNPDIPDISEIYLDMQMDCILAWAEATRVNLLESLQKEWELGESYSLFVSLSEGCSAAVNSAQVKYGEFSGNFFTGCETVIRPQIPEGQIFSRWEVNGEIYNDKQLTIEEDMIVEGQIMATLFTDPSMVGGLRISGIKAKGKSDYILLENTSSEPVSTWGYYLADKDTVSDRNYLEDMVVAPGQTILAGCKNYDGADSITKLNFSLKKGENLVLGYADEGAVESVEIPDLGLNEGIYEKQFTTGEWHEKSLW